MQNEDAPPFPPPQASLSHTNGRSCSGGCMAAGVQLKHSRCWSRNKVRSREWPATRLQPAPPITARSPNSTRSGALHIYPAFPLMSLGGHLSYITVS